MAIELGFQPTLAGVIDAMSRKGYPIFNTPGRSFNLNLVGIRTFVNVPNRFDDWLTLFYTSNGQWIFNAFPATTDPGLFYLGDRMGTELGTAILKEGRYRDAYQLGKHQGRYKALVQTGAEVTVARDFDRDGQLDPDSAREESGFFGINIHRASRARASVSVDAWSAGCQVLCDPLQYNYLMEVCERGRREWGNSFTYTLLHERDFAPA